MSRPTICIAVPLEDDLAAQLAAAGDIVRVEPGASLEELIAALPGVDGMISPTHFNLGEDFFAAAPGLRVVSQHAVGYNNIDIDAATRHGVAICNTPGVLNAAVADLTMAIIIMLARRLFEFEAFSRSGAWARGEPFPPLAHEISGKVLGVIGFGRIGREVARRMQAIGMRTIWYDIFEGAATATIDDPQDAPYRPLDDLLRESDYVTIHTNLTAESHHLIGARELALMKPSAYIVNTARGPVIDQVALVAALEGGVIAGAGLDVLEAEPPDPDDPIVRLPNVITFPHIGTAAEETRRAMRELAVRNLIAVVSGETPPAIVNPEVLASQAGDA